MLVRLLQDTKKMVVPEECEEFVRGIILME